MVTAFGLMWAFMILSKHFGQTVSNLCANGRCCDGFIMDKTTDTCIACPDGFIGNKCEKACIYPNYGKECQSICKCSEELCNVSVGCVRAKTVFSHMSIKLGSTRQVIHSTSLESLLVKHSTISAHGNMIANLLLTTVGVFQPQNGTTRYDTKYPVPNHDQQDETAYVINISIFVLFGITVVLLLSILYVYNRQRMYSQHKVIRIKP